MKQNIDECRFKTRFSKFAIKKLIKKNANLRHEVWWYGPVEKNVRAQTVPLVAVMFRRCYVEGDKVSWFPREDQYDSHKIPITFLNILRIGTLWDNEGRMIKERMCHKEFFEINLSEKTWRFIRPDSDAGAVLNECYHLNDHMRGNGGWMLEFTDIQGRRFNIPCLEFFTWCYGVSVECRRILATYDFNQVLRRYFGVYDGPVHEEDWEVCLKKELVTEDRIFLAHILHDPYAERCAKLICSHLAGFFNKRNPPTQLKVEPWFQGRMSFGVEGLWQGNSFLVLRITGVSEPTGRTIRAQRENDNDPINPAPEEDRGQAFVGAQKTIMIDELEIVPLTGDFEPDQNGRRVLDKAVDKITILGARRRCIQEHRQQGKSTAGEKRDGEPSSQYSSGEPSGSGKDTGRITMAIETNAESHGKLIDMWHAILKAAQKYPDRIGKAEWYVREDTFSNDDSPKLNPLADFTEEDWVQDSVKEWLKVKSPYSPKSRRGVLVVRLLTSSGIIGLIEIQRDQYIRKRIDGTEELVENHLQGFIFLAQDNAEFKTRANDFLNYVRREKGVVANLASEWPRCSPFKHSSPKIKPEVYPCEVALRNALSKMGLKLPT